MSSKRHRLPDFVTRGEAKQHNTARIATASGVVVALVAVATFIFGHWHSPKQAKISVVNLVVTDGDSTSRVSPALSVTLENSGDYQALVTRARVKILSSSHLRTCYTGGDIPSGGNFDVRLPSPGRGTSVPVADLHHQVRAEDADRFTLTFSSAPLPKAAPTDFGRGSYLYRAELTLYGSGGDGQRLVTTPPFFVITPVASALVTQLVPEQFVNEDGTRSTLEDAVKDSFGTDDAGARSAAECYRQNNEKFDRAIAQSGAKSEALRQLVNDRNSTPPRY